LPGKPAGNAAAGNFKRSTVVYRMSDEEKNHDPAEAEETPGTDPSATDALPEEEATGLAEGGGEEEYDEEEGEQEEVEFDLEAQIEEFRRQIEEEPGNAVHHYNLGEALTELGQQEEALEEFARALELDEDHEYSAIVHFARGELYFQKTISGIQGTVVRSSVGLHSAHKPGASITDVDDEDYAGPIAEFEAALRHMNTLKADEDIAEYLRKNVPQRIADTYYKWGSDLIDKSRQIRHYGDEIKDVKVALKLLKKTLEIDPSHSQANLMVKYAKKMLQEGWKAYDEYGFEAKSIQGQG